VLKDEKNANPEIRILTEGLRQDKKIKVDTKDGFIRKIHVPNNCAA
jgi:hypothetical protein